MIRNIRHAPDLRSYKSARYTFCLQWLGYRRMRDLCCRWAVSNLLIRQPEILFAARNNLGQSNTCDKFLDLVRSNGITPIVWPSEGGSPAFRLAQLGCLLAVKTGLNQITTSQRHLRVLCMLCRASASLPGPIRIKSGGN
jgi:hypothetical protein